MAGPSEASHSSATLPVTDILPSALQQKQQQQQQQQLSVQPTVSVARLPGRPTAFIPLEDVKGARSSGINIITREQVKHCTSGNFVCKRQRKKERQTDLQTD